MIRVPYTTSAGEQYQILMRSDRRRSSLGSHFSREPWYPYCDWAVLPNGDKGQEGFLFSIGCYDRTSGGIPQKLAPALIQWLLELEDLPSPDDYCYLGVFTRDGLRHRKEGQVDQRFGVEKRPSLQDVVDFLENERMEARNRGRQIGFRSSRSELWTQKSEIAHDITQALSAKS